MAIITISREVGSLGTAIAKKVTEDLGFSIIDRGIIEKELSRHYDISAEKAARYDEKVPSIWDFSLDKERYLHYMKSIMYDVARKKSCVVIGRGGQYLFQGLANTLHVRVFAPYELRLKRVMKRYTCSEEAAGRIIRHSDHDRAGFHKFFFNIDWEDQRLYDLVINTRTINMDAAVQMIKDVAATTKLLSKTPDAGGKIADMCLSQQVFMKIKYAEKLGVQMLEVEAEKGIVTIWGMAATEEDVQKCGKIAGTVAGVKKVVNEITTIKVFA
ncbi:MAG TPA: cytidylate kinase family protein [Smithellaceae bacterium]|nr:cytidylate kinase family protein [Smithellaceae bacterium]